MVKDFNKERYNVLMEYIIDCLENGKTEELIGLQTLDCATQFTGYQGMQSLVNALLSESVKTKSEAKELRKKIEEEDRPDSIALTPIKKRELNLLEKGYVSIKRIQNILYGLRKHSEDIQKLLDYQMLEIYGNNTGNPTYFRLNPTIWDTTIKKIRQRDGEEIQVYGNAIGKVIAMATRERGFNSLIPLINCYTHANSEGEITKKEFLNKCSYQISRPKRFFINMVERDKMKNKEIRAFVGYKEDKFIMNPNGIKAIRNWTRLASRRAQQRHN